MLFTQRSLFLAGAFVAVVFCDEGGEDEYDDQDIMDDSITEVQLRKLHSRFDANQDGRVGLGEILSFAAHVGKEISAKDSSAIVAEIDSNQDGIVSLDEHLQDVHQQADTNNPEEMQQLQARKALETEKFSAADTNGDSFLDASELPALFYPETHEGVLDVTVQNALLAKDKNKDGKLSPKEFWETDLAPDIELSEEEKEDFGKLDTDGDGQLSLEELRVWESGGFHTREAMRKLFDLADKDADMHVTADELALARMDISASDAQYHLIEWIEHFDEL